MRPPPRNAPGVGGVRARVAHLSAKTVVVVLHGGGQRASLSRPHRGAPVPAPPVLEAFMEYICILFYIALIVVMLAAMWKVYEKAGQPGWAAIVPFYNA
jgi:hypothetical protein